MTPLHLAPNLSAGSAIRAALQALGRDEPVRINHDDHSCGPINSLTSDARIAWWTTTFTGPCGRDHVDHLVHGMHEFNPWDGFDRDHSRVTVWFGSGSAQETAFYLAFSDLCNDMPLHVVDTSTLGFNSAAAIDVVQADQLLATARPVLDSERRELSHRWQQLARENTPFRVMGAEGLFSASSDVFDSELLEHVSNSGTPVARVIAQTMGSRSYPIADYVLEQRIIALVSDRAILADDDPISLGSLIRKTMRRSDLGRRRERKH
ncbi:DUF3658 domain-containing protein [Nocardia nova]|uniref:DUF3658 domain-containing protein n=1 Tax=Nocardia nova TaxID=37330 RepID=UPI001C490B74|nr:DUF3658 domain-containing protein [Nocardia nova]MBV7704158.1 DUF1835 domain-containing protein [Nocardia nova]